MVTPPFTALTKFLAARYPQLGPPLKLAPMTFDFRVSNNLFEYATQKGRYLLKVMAHPRALYGQMDVRDRLELVGRAVFQLGRVGFPVEEIIAGDESRFVQGYEGHLLRLYRFHEGRGYAFHETDMRVCARSLRRLHQEGLSCLDSATRAELVQLEKPYPLPTTAPELPELEGFVREEACSRQTYANILEHWDTIEMTVQRVLNHRPSWGQPTCLVHTDFHPRNVLFSPDGSQATMIDLDNIVVGQYLHCLAFAILRFAFCERERAQDVLQETIAIFAPDEHRHEGFLDDLLHAMLYVEIEKVLRILKRVRTTGQYAGFVDNIGSLHLPNIRFISASLVCA